MSPGFLGFGESPPRVPKRALLSKIAAGGGILQGTFGRNSLAGSEA